MISLKQGVKLTDMTPQCVLAAMVVDQVLTSMGIPMCVLTSVNDGKHSPQSWHYHGRAVDVRTKYPELNGREMELRDKVAAALGPNFDVVMEAIGTDNEHLHVEYDPK